jgi:hypothetical protein
MQALRPLTGYSARPWSKGENTQQSKFAFDRVRGDGQLHR